MSSPITRLIMAIGDFTEEIAKIILGFIPVRRLRRVLVENPSSLSAGSLHRCNRRTGEWTTEFLFAGTFLYFSRIRRWGYLQ